MPRLRAVRTAEEAAKIPEDQSIAVILPGEGEEAPSAEARGEDQREDDKKSPLTEGEASGQQAKEASKEPAVDQEAEEGQEQESEALKKRLGELVRAEQAAQDLAAVRQREIERLSQAHLIEQGNTRRETMQAHWDALSNGLLAAQSESEAAQRDWESAAAEGDFKRQSDANVRINRAQARLLQYEDAKVNLEAQAKAADARPQQQQQQADPLERLPEPAKQWLRAHPEYLTDQRKNRKIQVLHDDALEQGHPEFSPAYFEFVETQLGMRQPKQSRNDDDDSVSTRRERNTVSAPVSREAVSMRDGRSIAHRITLSPEQRSAAKIAGITEVEYAKQLIRLEKAKREGSIQ